MSVLTTPYYTTGEMLSALKGMTNPAYQGDIWRFLFEEYDAHNYGTEYQVPVYYIQGENDWQTPCSLAKVFFDEISAPHKKFFTIPNAGHVANRDNKEAFTCVLVEEIRPLLDE